MSTVTKTWKDPIANLDLAAGARVSEQNWDDAMSDIAYLDSVVEPGLTNKSGSAVATGDVVVLDVGNDSAFSLSTIEGYNLTAIGVVVDSSIANNAAGRGA